MFVRLLGTAAGGGLPQWNCSCVNCQAARSGHIPARSQSCIAISADGASWFLVNASPDLQGQLQSFPALQPIITTPRNSPLSGVLLTNADLDHILGLIQLREGDSYPVVATQAVKETLNTWLGFDSLMGAFCGIRWIDVSTDFTPLLLRNGVSSRLLVRTIALPGEPPRYVKQNRTGQGHSVAFQISDERGSTLLIAPDVAALTPELQDALEESDAVLFDGTFWSENELRLVTGHVRSASEMGHLPIQNGGLQALEKIPARHKIFTHINNTNPILTPDSPERAAVMAAGISIGEDNMEFEL